MTIKKSISKKPSITLATVDTNSPTKTEPLLKSTKNFTEEISFPLLEKISTNKIYSGVHWSVRNRLKNDYHLFMLQFKGKLGFEESDYPLDIEYTFTWKTGPLDTTNQTFLIKMMEDGLVDAGVLIDDDYRYVRSTTSISMVDRDIKADFVKIRFKKKGATEAAPLDRITS